LLAYTGTRVWLLFLHCALKRTNLKNLGIYSLRREPIKLLLNFFELYWSFNTNWSGFFTAQWHIYVTRSSKKASCNWLSVRFPNQGAKQQVKKHLNENVNVILKIWFGPTRNIKIYVTVRKIRAESSLILTQFNWRKHLPVL
jgi:hypothetical protein